ncbi:uncharacterized protein LOC135208125 [Macrobrachium nipponense]|uniref:uncharacterized protein LOC135208125 n=1 Tax=Macrobrachium nipponense TaxID=159736 RepID=UPI0030C8A18C
MKVSELRKRIRTPRRIFLLEVMPGGEGIGVFEGPTSFWLIKNLTRISGDRLELISTDVPAMVKSKSLPVTSPYLPLPPLTYLSPFTSLPVPSPYLTPTPLPHPPSPYRPLTYSTSPEFTLPPLLTSSHPPPPHHSSPPVPSPYLIPTPLPHPTSLNLTLPPHLTH